MKTVAFLIYVTALVCYGDSKIPELTVDPSPEVIPTIEEFCDALTDAIKSVRKHEDDDEAFIDEYCEYIRIEHKLDIKEYDDLKDFKHLVVHYRQYKKWKKRVKKMNKKAKTIKVNGKVLKEVFGDTPFSDLTDDEMAKRFPKTEDTSEASDADTARRLIQHGCTLISGSAFASTNNQRETIISNSKCNIVKDQGPSNACWAFATAEQATCNYNTQKNGNLEFNVQHLLDCSSNTQGTKASGGFFDRASQWAESKGFCSSYNWAFNPNAPDKNHQCGCNVRMQRSNCYGFYARNNFDGLTRLIAAGYAVSVGIKFDVNFQSCRGNLLTQCNPNLNAYNHAVTLVGQYFGQYVLVKNSHGLNWGSRGYTWVSRAAFESCLFGDYVYLNFDFYPGGYYAKSELPKPDIHDNDKNINGGGDNIKNNEYYLTVISGLVGIIIGAALMGVSCVCFIWCVFTKTSSNNLNKFRYNKVIASDTSDSDALSVNM